MIPASPVAHDRIGTISYRPLTQQDRDALLGLDGRVSPESLYWRFFSSGRALADDYVDVLLSHLRGSAYALGAFVGAELVGVAAYDRIDDVTADVAILVDDRLHHAGVGSVLLARLADAARAQGVEHFVADVLTYNVPVRQLIRASGLPSSKTLSPGVTEYTIDLSHGSTEMAS